MKVGPLVSIIVVCYNQARFVRECLESVRLQTYANTELIVIDDCSGDDSAAVIESWIAALPDKPTFIVHERNQGICKTFNEALSNASGKYVSIIAADDVYLPDKTETQVTLFESLPENVGVIYSDVWQMDACGNLLKQHFIESQRDFAVMPQGNLFDALLQGNFIPAMSTMVRRECYAQVGRYDEQLTYEDFDMWLRISRHYEFVFSPVISAKYRVLPTSLSRTIHAAGQWPLLKSDFRIYENAMTAGLTGAQRTYARKRLAGIARQMCVRDYPGRTPYVARLLRYQFTPLTMILLLCSMAGVPYRRLSNLKNFYRYVIDKSSRMFSHGYQNEIRE
ncbi:MAG TPA: glycosyltransferase [Pyrinomonadaceae bacterium]|nr:glycosyltransferase [Pyrinomonadaceae bacterium]